MIEESTPGGVVYYIREPNGSLVARVAGSEIHYYHFDELGSTRLLTDGSGTVTDRYAYDAYGSLIAHDRYSGSIDQPYQYVGRLGYYTHHQEPEFGLLQLGVRFYDAEVGRFTSRDVFPQVASSVYSYVDNAPMNWIDSNGQEKKGIPDIDKTWKDCITEAVNKYCDKNKVSRKMIRCMIYCETKPKDNPKSERKNGAKGLMQIMPEWWDKNNRSYCLHKRWGQKTCDDIVPGFKPTNACDSITCGVYLFCKVHNSSTDEYGTTNCKEGRACMDDCMKRYQW